MTQKISIKQILELGADETAGMLLYLTGYLGKSAEFQDALARAYAAEMRMRARLAARAS